ncbi:MAG: phosphopantothenate/pantothenate synthetase [archaeon]|nr:phosphopantothenate/pantothenate synthetase [archaeon]
MNMRDIPADHPRALSLRLRETIEHFRQQGLVAETGPIAHGRGEAFDYILGEATPELVKHDIYTAAALLLEARHPIISVNGNAAVLAPEALIELSRTIPAELEVNVFYGRTQDRERKIADYLISKGASKVLGVNPTAKIPRLTSSRGRVDKDGIAKADVVLIPLEDGDRTEALVAWGKKVISIDLNPLSRTALKANINICDNLIRAVPLLTSAVIELRQDPDRRRQLVDSCDNNLSICRVLQFMASRLVRFPFDHGLVRIQNADESHIDFIVTATQSCIEEGSLSHRQRKVVHEFMRDRLDKEGIFILVATFNGRPCGYGDGECRDDGTFYLARLVVAKPFRGMGIGSAILSKIEDIARSQGCHKIVLETLVSCRQAQALYSMHNFNPEGFLTKDGYKCDFIVMGKHL